MISAGERIPDHEFQYMSAHGPSEISTGDIFAGRNVVLFGVPGAFTPSCHQLHLPSYIEEYETLRDAGIDIIACTAVNDIFVLDIWARASGAHEKILFLADGSAEFAAAMGLKLDARQLGFGFRSRRYALWARDGVVQAINVEDNPTLAEVTTAYCVLNMFKDWAQTT